LQIVNAKNPEKIMERSVRAASIDSLHGEEVHLISETKSGKKKHKIYEMWRKKIGNTDHKKTMSRFHSPRKIKGQGVLIIESGDEKSGNDIRMYLPAYKRVRRIERQMQSGSFMGTAFYYSDLVTHEVKDYSYKYYKQMNCPVNKKEKCHKILCTPKTDDIKERRGYAKFFVWVNTKNYMTDALVGYNEKNKKIKTIKFEQNVKIGKKWLAKKITASDHKSNRSAIYHIKKFKHGKVIGDDYFTENYLKNP
jgi:hypothetical protein